MLIKDTSNYLTDLLNIDYLMRLARLNKIHRRNKATA